MTAFSNTPDNLEVGAKQRVTKNRAMCFDCVLEQEIRGKNRVQSYTEQEVCVRFLYLRTAMTFLCCTDKAAAAGSVAICCFSAREDVRKILQFCLRLYCKSELCHGNRRLTQLMTSLIVTVAVPENNRYRRLNTL